jgi:hypothetical protein
MERNDNMAIDPRTNQKKAVRQTYLSFNVPAFKHDNGLAGQRVMKAGRRQGVESANAG